ncbi:response regulator [bacterium]|nr:response regulator [bacterium]
MAKILVIDDDKMIRSVTSEILSIKGYEVETASKGQEGIGLAKNILPDLIICDISMPEMNGFEVLSELRKDYSTRNIPFIFLTGVLIQKHDVRKGMDLGADDYLTKPFKIIDLIAAVEARIQRQKDVLKQIEELRLNISSLLPHELFTPLTGIIGFSDFLTDKDNLPETQEEIAELGQAIHRNGLQLLRLMENYLLYSELKLAEYEKEKRENWQTDFLIETKTFIKNIALAKAEKLGRKKDLEINLAATPLKISFSNLQKILEELLDNAFKFSAKETKVFLTSIVQDGKFILKIKNYGNGMTKEQIMKIGAFMQFERGKYEQQGSGLGLIIAKLLAGFNQGTLEIESEIGKELIVTLTFPCVKKNNF